MFLFLSPYWAGNPVLYSNRHGRSKVFAPGHNKKWVKEAEPTHVDKNLKNY